MPALAQLVGYREPELLRKATLPSRGGRCKTGGVPQRLAKNFRAVFTASIASRATS